MNIELSLENKMKSRKLFHAYMITGEKRAELAQKLAAAMVCTGDEPPCGVCPHCRKAGAGIHPDIRSIVLETREQVKSVRVLCSDAYTQPNEAPCKVYLYTNAELLSEQSQNALLKTIEEGPSYAAFLLLTSAPDALLATIRSRCEELRAMGEDTHDPSPESIRLTELITRHAGPAEKAEFITGLEKCSREELAAIIQDTAEALVRVLPQQPELLPVMDRLEPILNACEFNIGVGHLSGWLMGVL